MLYSLVILILKVRMSLDKTITVCYIFLPSYILTRQSKQFFSKTAGVKTLKDVEILAKLILVPF
jgi:hypothetical protein